MHKLHYVEGSCSRKDDEMSGSVSCCTQLPPCTGAHGTEEAGLASSGEFAEQPEPFAVETTIDIVVGT